MRDRTIEALIAAWDREAAAVGDGVSVCVRSLDAPVASVRGDVPHYAASTIKLAVGIAALAATARGELDSSSALVVRSSFPSMTAGTFTMRQRDDQDDSTWRLLGGTLPLSLLVERMIVSSSNIATNLVVQELGLDRVREVLAAAGAGDIKIRRLIGDEPAEAAGLTNEVTATALARLLVTLATGRLLPPDQTDALLGMAARQTYRRLVPAGLPKGTWSAGKAGWNDVVKHDVALVRPREAPPYVLAVCTTTGLGDQAERLVAAISKLTWEHWTTTSR